MPKNNVINMRIDEVSLVDKGTNPGAHFVLMKKQILKKEKEEDFPIEAYAYTPDINDPNTWKLKLWDSIAKKETSQHISKLIVAFSKGLRTNQIKISDTDLVKIKKKLIQSWYNINTIEKREETVKVLEIIQKGYGKTFDELMYENEVIWMLWDAISVLEESFYSIMFDEDITDKKLKIDETTSQFQQSINKIKGDVNVDELEILQKKFDELKAEHDVLVKNHVDEVAKNEQLQKDLTEAQSTKEEKEIKKKEAEAKAKDMPENIRKKFEEFEKRDKDQAELIAKLLDDKESTIYFEKAKKFENLPMETKEVGSLLKSIGNAIDEKEMESLMLLFSAIDKAISKGKLFEEIGSGGSGNDGDAFTKMLGKADELKKANPNLTKEKAFVKVMEEDPELYNQYLKEQNV